MAPSRFDAQFTLSRAEYVKNLDMVTWLRHFHVLQDLLEGDAGDVLEVGTGDGVVRRTAEPLVRSYRVLDINPNLEPDFLGDLRANDARLVGAFDTIVVTEVMEHLPFGDLPACLANLGAWLRPGGGGRVLASVPHRKSSVALLPPNQKLHTFRFPNGLTPSEFYNRFVRGKIWIDPNHRWEIGDGHVRRADVERQFANARFIQLKRRALPYSDYWVLSHRPPAAGS